MPERVIPFYAKSTVILLGLTLLTLALFMGRDILVPLAFAVLLAVLLNPVLRFLESLRIPKLLAITLTVLLAIAIVVGLAFFITFQMGQFTEALPQLKVKLMEHLHSIQVWLTKAFNLSETKQKEYFNRFSSNMLSGGGGLVSGTFSYLTDLLVIITLVPIYVFLLLLYRNLLVYFVIEVFSAANSIKVSDILHEIKTVIQNYIVGLLFETVIVAFLNTMALLMLGIEYAVLLGVLGAILNLVPYLGGIVAIALPVLIALVTKDGLFYPLAIIGAYSVIQFLDNNVIVPKVVAGKVRINALVSILAVLAGGALWGVSGMFLSIPAVAILKIIFDRVAPLKPWGMLLGDTIPQEAMVKATALKSDGIILINSPDN
ncbi:AI-2E family transporter [Adhaeribacter sp. BT258]|uniref:AI-2E family transporter n=1 Tax=Adhaeribacter terrigena TaxID=2793070 RepID=A0ABS1C302_9BACT|nr:AI-2E family transporter [Adhaeribacter terrigena]MBK0403742.1 AI-2E family transporter [Adhaeribacter terrigena]